MHMHMYHEYEPVYESSSNAFELFPCESVGPFPHQSAHHDMEKSYLEHVE